MSSVPPAVAPPPVEYPDSDGKPMADNTLQADWITKLFGNLKALLDARPDVFVAMDLLWYPVEGEPGVRAAPDVLVAFGRPKGYRGSYKQWEEGNVPVTVAFEVLSPSNTSQEMSDKRAWYEEHGVEEYYVFDPEAVPPRLEIYLRKGDVFRREYKSDGFVSPRLGIRFELSSGPEMAVWRPDGRPFLPFEEVDALQRRTERERDEQQKRADDEQKRADDQQKRADDAVRRLARLVDLGRKARSGQATAEDLAELEQLESGPET